MMFYLQGQTLKMDKICFRHIPGTNIKSIKGKNLSVLRETISPNPNYGRKWNNLYKVRGGGGEGESDASTVTCSQDTIKEI